MRRESGRLVLLLATSRCRAERQADTCVAAIAILSAIAGGLLGIVARASWRRVRRALRLAVQAERGTGTSQSGRQDAPGRRATQRGAERG